MMKRKKPEQKIKEQTSPLPGRQAELHLIERELARVAGGEARFIALVGETGVGKTRLLREAARRATGRTLWLRQAPERLTPEDLLEQWLSPIVHQAPGVPGARDVALAAASYPRLAELSPVAGGLPNQANPARAQAAIARLLASAAERQPLVLPVDALPHYRPETRALVIDLAVALADAPVAFLATARQETLDPFRDRVFEPLVERHLLMRIEVRPLDEEGIRQLLVEELDPAMATTILPWLYERSRGNALFAIELVRALRGQGILHVDAESGVWQLVGRPEEVRLPETIAHVLESRRQALPAPLTDLVPALALLGADAPASCVAHALGIADEDVEQARDELVGVGILERSRSNHAFQHPLMAEHWAATLCPADQRVMAGRALDCILGDLPARMVRGSSATGFEHVADREFPLIMTIAAAAQRPDIHALAGIEQGRRCLRGRRIRESATWVRRADHQLARVSGSQKRRWLSAQLDQLMGSALYLAGRLRTAESRLRRFIAEPEATDPHYGIKAFSHLGNLLIKQSRAEEARHALGAVIESLGRVDSDPARIARCEMLCRLVWNELDHGSPDAAAGYLDAAASALGEPPPPDAAFAEANLLNNRGHLQASQGEYRQAVQTFQQLIRLSRSRSPFGLPGYINNLAWTMTVVGELEAARGLAEEALRLKRRAEDRYGISLAWLTIGNIDLLAGNWSDSATAFEQALESATQAGNSATRAYAQVGLMGALEWLGRQDEGDRHWREGVESCREKGVPSRDALHELYRARGDVLCRRGDWSGAHDVLRHFEDAAIGASSALDGARIEMLLVRAELGQLLEEKRVRRSGEGGGKRKAAGSAKRAMTAIPASRLRALAKRLAAREEYLARQELRGERLELARIRLQLCLAGWVGAEPGALLEEVESNLSAMGAAARFAAFGEEFAGTALEELPLFRRRFMTPVDRGPEAGTTATGTSAAQGSPAVGTTPGDLRDGIESADPPRELVRIYTLGRLRVLRAASGEPITRADWGSRKARLLLACILAEDLEGRRGVTREHLLEAVWPDSDSLELDRTFHVTLTFLRRALGATAKTRGSRLIEYDDGYYRADFASVWCDARVFQDEVHQAAALERQGQNDTALRLYRRAFERYDGEFLGSFDELWLEPRREQLRRRFVELGGRLAGSASAAGRLDEAEEIAERLVSCDPLAEEGHAQLIRAYMMGGRRDAALRQLERCRELLREQLGVEVSESTARLVQHQ